MLDLKLVICKDTAIEWKDRYLDYNLTCVDDKVHIRFKHFDKPVVIYGLEKKLAFVVTYLMSKVFYENTREFELDQESVEKLSASQFDKMCFEKWVNKFTESDYYQALKQILKCDIKLSKAIRSKGFTQFGDVVNIDSEFISTDVLINYVVDDSISFEIRDIYKTRKKDPYKKFNDKEVRKNIRQTKKQFTDSFVDEILW